MVAYQSLPGSRASMERMVGSGSEPTYQPRTSYTSWAGLVLYVFLGAASAVEAAPTIRTRAIAVFVNMVGVSSLGVLLTPRRCAPASRSLADRR
jgi:hypothetical protein